MDNALVLTAPLPTLTFGARLTTLASATIEAIFGSAAEAERRRARLYFRVVLALSTATSIAGNGAHAWVSETIDVPRQLAVAVAVAPPVILMLSIEGVAILVRNLRTFNFVAWLALTMTALIAIGAFVLSFESLRDLAIRSGISIGLAFLWPAIVDVTIAQSTIALVVLTPRAKEPATEGVEVDTEDSAESELDNSKPDADHALRATKVLKARRRLRKNTDEVQRVLALADRGEDITEIATQTEMHPSTVRRILAADLAEPAQ